MIRDSVDGKVDKVMIVCFIWLAWSEVKQVAPKKNTAPFSMDCE